VSEAVVVKTEEIIETRPFTHPNHSIEDLDIMHHITHQLVDTYDDPVLCDFIPGKRAICQSDPRGRHFRIYYIQPQLLFSLKGLTVVGFFGQKRPDADVRPLLKADRLFEREFHNHPGLLSLSTVRLANGDFGNLVLFTDPEAKDNWNFNKLHYDIVSVISAPYYKSIRLNNGYLPAGLDAPDELRLIRVRYMDFSTDTPWRATRNFEHTAS